jgi:hypothetical protein
VDYFLNLTITSSIQTSRQKTRLTTQTKTASTLSKSSSTTISSFNLHQSIDVYNLTGNQIVAILGVNMDITNCLLNCSNRGSCIFDTVEFKCNCFKHYTGAVCEYDMRKCSSQICLNNGTCTDLIDSKKQYYFKCDCMETFAGKHCEIPLDICENVTCSSNGYCVKEENKPVCKCFYLYSGLLCEFEANSRRIIRGVITSSTIIAIVTVLSVYLLVVFNDFVNVFLKNQIPARQVVKGQQVVYKNF